MKKIFYFIIFIISMFSFNVYASNDVDYTLTITDDFKFKEVINYSITDYKQITNGYNYFSTIVSDNIYTDIFYNIAYDKTKTKTNNGYKVKLSHTYSEYSFSNSNFLNNCFENSSFDYDIDEYSFEGTGGFYCLNGDSLKITIVTNMNVASSNAIKSGNKYVWNPVNEKFAMNIKIDKKYEESNANDEEYLDDISESEDPSITGDSDNNVNSDSQDTDINDNNQVDNQNQKNTTGYIIGGIILVMCVIVILIIARVLKQKKSNLNKI